MSNDMGQEDTVLGSALRRAIETQRVRATPFSESRVAMRLAGRERRSPLLPMLAAAAAVVLGLALGAALLGQRGTEPGPVASSPTPSPDTTGSPAGSPTASPTATPGTDRIWVYFAVDQLPPVGAEVRGTFDATSAESRIASRVFELWRTRTVPNGATNVVSKIGGIRDRPLLGGTALKVEGDLATVDFEEGAFEGIRGAAETQALLQQLVYTITEEPGIRRALIREAGKNAEIDQLVIDKPLTREDVLPYEGVKTEQRVELQDDPRPSETKIALDTSKPEVTRFTVEVRAKQTPEGGFWTPRMVASLVPNGSDVPGKWVLVIELEAATHVPTAGDTAAESSPVRSVRVTDFPPSGARGSVYNLFLDDARPWRVSLEPGQPGTMRVIVDIGGHPQAVSNGVAVYGPTPGSDVARTFTLTGTARAFEAHVAWRIKDASQREVASGFAMASIGTSPVWGTFTTEVKVPANVSGNVTLEVFWPSPRDGADVDTVAIPLRLR
jgi:hypothetical protein